MNLISDIDTSKWYRLTKAKLCVGEKDVLCPINFFIDETIIDTKGHLTLEPVSFTLGIFNRACRMTPQAWCHLGFVPKMDKNVPISKVNIDDLPLVPINGVRRTQQTSLTLTHWKRLSEL